MSIKDLFKSIYDLPIFRKAGEGTEQNISSKFSSFSNQASDKISSGVGNAANKDSRDKYTKAYDKIKAKRNKKSGNKNGLDDDSLFDKKRYHNFFRSLSQILSSNKRSFADTNIVLTLGEYSDAKRDLFEGAEMPSFYASNSNQRTLNNQYVNWHIDRDTLKFDIDKKLLSFDKEKNIKDSGYGIILQSIKNMSEHKSLSAIMLRIPVSLFKSVTEKQKEARNEKIRLLAQQYYNLLSFTFKTFLFKIPVYVLLTEAEEIYGFKDFLSILTKDEKEQYFGWSNPNDFELPYSENVSIDFLDNFKNTVDNFIAQKMIENLDPEKMKNVLIFKNDLFIYIQELRTFIDFLFVNNKFYEYSGLRGVYLCGYEKTDSSSKPLGTDIHGSLFQLDEESKILKEKDEQEKFDRENRNLLFLRGLYVHKLIKELNLNVPTKDLLRKNKENKIISLILLFLVIFSLPFMYYSFNKNTVNSYNQINEALFNLEPAIKMTVAQDTVNSQNSQVDLTDLSSVYAVLQNRNSTQLRSIFSPLTLFSGIDARVNYLLHGSVVLMGAYPAYSLLQNQITSVQQIGTNNKTLFGVGEAYNIFVSYLKNVTDLERDLTIYDVFSDEINVDKLDSLLQYLIGSDLSDFFRNENILIKNIAGQFRIKPIDSNLLKPIFTGKYEVLFNNLLRTVANDEILKDISNNIITSVDAPASAIQNNNNYVFLRTLFSNLDEVKKNLDLYSSSVQILTSSGVEIKLDTHNEIISRNTLIVRKPQADIDKLLTQAVNRRNAAILTYVSTTLGNLYFFKDKDSPPRLAEKFLDLDSLLMNLQDTDFFNANKLNQNGAPLAIIENGFDWNKINLQRILDEIAAYEKYMNDNLKKFPDSLQPVITNAGISGMLDMIVNQMNSDTIKAAQSSGDVDFEVGIFNANKDGIIKILDFISKSSQSDLYKSLVDLTLEKAVYFLSYYTKQLNETVHYRPKTNDFTWWDGSTPPALNAYMVYGQTELNDYVAKQNAKVGNLLKAHTQRLIDLISALATNTTYQQNQDYLTWSGISKQYNDLLTNGTGSLQILSDFILKTLTSVDVPTCLNGFDAVNSESTIDNYFSGITKDVAASLQKQCQLIYENQVAINYNKVVAVFNSKITGNFPFTDSFSADTATEVSVSDLRDFITLFKSYFTDDSFIDKIKSFHDKNWILPLVFMKKMMNVSKFFWPLLGDSKSPPNNQFYVLVDFNTSKENEINTNALLERRYYVDSNFITNLALEQKAIWSPSESVSIVFHWAKDANVMPVALSSNNNAKFAEASNGFNISLTAIDQWSLIYLIQKYSRIKDEYYYSPEVYFDVPLKRVIDFKRNFVIANNSFAHVGMRVQFYDSNKSDLLTVPVFPTEATPMKIDPLFLKNTGN